MKDFIVGCAVVMVVGFAARAAAQTPDTPPEASPGAEGYAPYEPLSAPSAAPAAVPSSAPSLAAPSAAPATPPEAAPTVGEVRHWAISLERGFGFDYVTETQTMNGLTQRTNSATTFSLINDPVADETTAFSFPRLGADLFVAPNLSVGASLGVFAASETFSSPGLTDANRSLKGGLVAPRVGYVARLSPWLSLWARAGLSLIYISTADTSGGATTSSGSFTLIAATFEAPVVFTVAPRIAFTFGPTVDYAFSGNSKSNATSTYAGSTLDDQVLEIGAQAGLVITL
jgi:hypothetical protein